jgi:hypothetical protein
MPALWPKDFGRQCRVAGRLGLFVGRRAVFASKIPAKISHSRGVVSDSSPCKISVQCHVVMSFIVSFLTVAFALFS